jgi:DNA-binding response OmpR family regulator
MTTILIIDDEESVGLAMKRTLERAGYHVTVCLDGARGVESHHQSPADLVITDVMMPTISGVEVITTLRGASSTLPIVAISGGGNFGAIGYKPEAITTTAYLAAAERAGANAVLTKPFDTAELLAIINRVLGD